MDEPTLRQLLTDVQSGAVAPDDAVTRLRRLPFADLGFARVDHHRPLRQGLPEAVYGPGKTPAQCAALVAELLAEPDGGPVLLTRATDDQATAALERSEGGRRTGTTIVWRPAATRPVRVPVVTAGTADLPVAEECLATLHAFGIAAYLVADCGVAGVHRLLASVEELHGADVIVVVAGMEGALPTL
ncbi:MAG: 1-(5-phosphoribosyl)-5-amino-4-imidazole-carboxylate carboxylase, partial [Actinobacteria bacterium]|nr:1-(5-phosphoribosyl)-5-amino-4-imidazole-carboxylate carboxylase [Actinomycetota bacterium]